MFSMLLWCSATFYINTLTSIHTKSTMMMVYEFGFSFLIDSWSVHWYLEVRFCCIHSLEVPLSGVCVICRCMYAQICLRVRVWEWVGQRVSFSRALPSASWILTLLWLRIKDCPHRSLSLCPSSFSLFSPSPHFSPLLQLCLLNVGRDHC